MVETKLGYIVNSAGPRFPDKEASPQGHKATPKGANVFRHAWLQRRVGLVIVSTRNNLGTIPRWKVSLFGWLKVGIRKGLVSWSSTSSPNTISPPQPSECETAHNAAAAATAEVLSLIYWSFGDSALGFDCLYDLVKLCLDDHTADNHFAQCGMQRLKIKDEVQFAYILKKAIKCLYEDLNKVKKSEGRLGRSGNDNKVQRRVVAVSDEGGRVVMWGARSRGFGAAGEQRRKAGARLAQVAEGKNGGMEGGSRQEVAC